jgi:vacuolar-type H+-ATPase catalytic subunit A/Vma1
MTVQTLFEAQRIYDTGRYDQRMETYERLLKLFKREAPGSTKKAREIVKSEIRRELMIAEYGQPVSREAMPKIDQVLHACAIVIVCVAIFAIWCVA